MNALMEEIANLAFYQGREVDRITDRGVIFKRPTFQGWLRDPKVKKEIERLEKMSDIWERAKSEEVLYELTDKLWRNGRTSMVIL